MKRSFYLMTMIIAALVLNACSAIDNPVTPDKQAGGGVITINTAAPYEELGVYDDMGILNENGYFITDTVLIYNESGRLVKKIGSTAQEMNTQTIAVDNLPNGTYTLVAWQAIKQFDEGETFYPVALSDEEELAKVKLELTTNNYMNWRFVVGMASATITVGGNAFEVTLTPKSMGKIVEMKAEKPCNEYGYFSTALYCLGSCVEGFYLDPSRTEADRWEKSDDPECNYIICDLQEEETAFKFFTLQQSDDTKMFLLGWYKDEEGQSQLEVLSGNATQKLQPGYNIYYFDMDRLNYQPPFLGSPDDFAIWKADRDAGKLVFDPYIKWGASYDDVKKHIAAKQWWAYSSKDYLYYEEGYGWIIDIYVSNKMYETYIFETEDGKNLNMAYASYLDEDDITLEDVNKTLLLQGYTYLGKTYNPDVDNDADYFVSADGETMAVTCKYPDPGIRLDILFIPFFEEEFENIGTPTATSRSIVPSKPHRTAAPTKTRSIDRKFAFKKPTATVR